MMGYFLFILWFRELISLHVVASAFQATSVVSENHPSRGEFTD